MKLLRYILFPFVPFYYLATWIRNKLYDWKIKSSKSYDVPVVCVGNLSTGGTGKTPMVEYLIRMLKNDYGIATISRGYGRKTKGLVIADATASPSSIGDEPFQFFSKFPEITVCVDSNRQNGIAHLLQLQPSPEVIILDDAFQHRKVRAGLNILLTSYDQLYGNDMLLPTGNLREPRSGAKRADIIVVTKCPSSLSEPTKQETIRKLGPLRHQHVLFSGIAYSKKIKNALKEQDLKRLKGKTFTLVTGIANSKPLTEFLHSEGFRFEHLDFRDHYEFRESDLELLKLKDLILTTEKDFVRFPPSFQKSEKLFYLPIETQVYDAERFDRLVRNFIADFQ